MKKIGLLLSLMFPVFALALPTAKYTLKVINISAEPIEGALAMVTFSKPKLDTWGSVPYGKKGLTDSDGIFIAEGETEQFGTYGARKEGFYPTSYQYKKMTDVTGIIGFRRWQPWNPTLEVVLKKIKNPIAMYAYDTDWIELPKKGEFVGYDLIKQDWLVPYGKGVTADFLLRIISEERSRFDYTIDLELAFSNEVDGIQAFDIVTNGGSEFKSDHLAPAESYGRGVKNRAESVPGKVSISALKDGRNYYFRTRCDDDVENCLYGKIYGDIDFGDDIIRFTYYLNPTPGDRNVEFDTKKNLFKQRQGYDIKQP